MNADATPPSQVSKPSRRTVLAALGSVGAASAVGAATLGLFDAQPAAAAVAKPSIRPRSDWADSAAKGPLPVEQAGDVKFLIVHHSETSNDYSPDRAAAVLRSMYNFHTSSEKGWNDIAYNFLVDKYGTIWEGRTGSLDKPVMGSATGGSQGFSQIVCFIGNHTSSKPTAAAQKSMIALLAWLASRYQINPRAGKTISFVSRGSNRWPKGTKVTTDPIVGHRDMSQTSCPGDACYPLVRNAFTPGVIALTPVAAHASELARKPVTRTKPAAAKPAGSTTTKSPPSSTPTSSSSSATAATNTPTAASTALGEADQVKEDTGIPWTPIAVGAGALAAVAGGAVASAMGRAGGGDVPDLHADPLDKNENQ